MNNPTNTQPNQPPKPHKKTFNKKYLQQIYHLIAAGHAEISQELEEYVNIDDVELEIVLRHKTSDEEIKIRSKIW